MRTASGRPRMIPGWRRQTLGRLALGALLTAGATTACSPDTPIDRNTLGYRAGGGLFDGTEFLDAEAWLGTDIHYTVQFAGRKSQRDMNGSVFGLLAGPEAVLDDFSDRIDLSITVPLGFGNANPQTREGREQIAASLVAVANGEFDDAYRRLAGRLIDGGYGDAIIRMAHEFNGSWAPWSSRTNEDLFIAAWRHVHGVLRAESPDFLFDWTALRPAWFEWGAAAYPGDDYVDIVGIDIYWRAQQNGEPWDSTVWERNFLRVLRDHQAFAIAHDKPLSYPEWGLSGADVPQFIEEMHNWLASLPKSGPGRLYYHAYFDDSGDFDLDQYPRARAEYRRLFGSN